MKGLSYRKDQHGRFGYGSYQEAATYVVVGQVAAFYVFVQLPGERFGHASRWVNGRSDLFNKLRGLHEGRKRDAFIALVLSIYKEKGERP